MKKCRCLGKLKSKIFYKNKIYEYQISKSGVSPDFPYQVFINNEMRGTFSKEYFDCNSKMSFNKKAASSSLS